MRPLMGLTHKKPHTGALANIHVPTKLRLNETFVKLVRLRS